MGDYINCHYIDKFHLNSFMAPYESKKNKYMVYCLNESNEINRQKTKDVCIYPYYNTMEQEISLSQDIHDKIAASKRKIISSSKNIENITTNDIFNMYELISLYLFNTYLGRLRTLSFEYMMLSSILKSDVEKVERMIRLQSVCNRIGISLKYCNKLYRKLVSRYKPIIVYKDQDYFITSDNPVVILPDPKNKSGINLKIDFKDISTKFIDKYVTFQLSYMIDNIDLFSSGICMSLSKRVLLILVPKRYSKREVNIEFILDNINTLTYRQRHRYAISYCKHNLIESNNKLICWDCLKKLHK